MPLTLDIRDVLRSCRLGPVALGHTRREVHDLLGPPDRWSDAPHMFSRKASIWLYGPLELHFAADPAEDMRLHLIWCDYLPFLETRMNPQGSLRLEPWIFGGTEPTTLAKLESALRAESLAFEVREEPGMNPRHHVVLESGVTFGLDDEGDGPVVAYLKITA